MHQNGRYETNHSVNEEKSEMKITRAGVDIAKSVFHVHAVDRHSHCQWQVKLKRSEWLDAMSEHLAPGADDRIAVPSRSACAGRSRSFGMRSSAASKNQPPAGFGFCLACHG